MPTKRPPKQKAAPRGRPVVVIHEGAEPEPTDVAWDFTAQGKTETIVARLRADLERCKATARVRGIGHAIGEGLVQALLELVKSAPGHAMIVVEGRIVWRPGSWNGALESFNISVTEEG